MTSAVLLTDRGFETVALARSNLIDSKLRDSCAPCPTAIESVLTRSTMPAHRRSFLIPPVWSGCIFKYLGAALAGVSSGRLCWFVENFQLASLPCFSVRIATRQSCYWQGSGAVDGRNHA